LIIRGGGTEHKKALTEKLLISSWQAFFPLIPSKAVINYDKLLRQTRGKSHNVQRSLLFHEYSKVSANRKNRVKYQRNPVILLTFLRLWLC
jgi:hypothetical protein